MDAPDVKLSLPADLPPESTVTVQKADLRVVRVRSESIGHAPASEDDSRVLVSESLLSRLRLEETRERYSSPELIGEGSTARVFSVHDANCNREIAVKVLKDVQPSEYGEQIRRFVAEGSVVASLEHPSIIPVYDMDIDDEGRVYLAMRRVQGHTLREYIDAAREGREDEAIHSLNDLIQVILKVCDGLAFAHSEGHTHQDIKPDNVMVGQFGEVFVIDWGASASADDELVLTPAYMSPQQARGQRPTASDDVYCLGATFFHCLFGRLPTDSDDLDLLVKKKRKGTIDPLTEEERRRVPASLTAIAMKALAGEPDRRYASITDFADDLKRFQQGQIVTAHEYSIWEALGFWYRSNRGLMLILSFLLATAFIVAGLTHYFERKQTAGWGKALIVEGFSNDDWQDRWLILNGEAEVQDGRLVTTSPFGFQMIYRPRLNGSYAIEFEGEMLRDGPQGDLSVIWLDGIEWGKDGRYAGQKGITLLQLGAYGNSAAMISRNDYRADIKPFRLKYGQTYKVRAEIEQRKATLYVNGKEVCVHRDAVPYTSGYIGIYGFYEKKAFDNIRIYRRNLPEMVPVTFVGDAYYREGQYQKAIEYYDHVIESHPGTQMALDARFRRGLCQFTEDPIRALQIWTALEDTEYGPRVKAYQAMAHFQNRQYGPALQLLEQAWAPKDAMQKEFVLALWDKFVTRLRHEDRLDWFPAFMKLRDRKFPDEKQLDFTIAMTLLHLGKKQQVLDEYSHIDIAAAWALMRMQRYEDLINRYPQQSDMCATALIRLGRFAEVIERYPNRRHRIAQVYYYMGAEDVVIRDYKDVTPWYVRALLREGRYREVVDMGPNTPFLPETWLLLGDPAKAVEAAEPGFARTELLLHLGRTQEILDDPNSTDLRKADALLQRGEYKRLLREFPGQRRHCAEAMIEQGNVRQMQKKYPEQSHSLNRIRMLQGKFQEIVDDDSPSNATRALALLALDRESELAAKTHGESYWQTVALASEQRLAEVQEDPVDLGGLVTLRLYKAFRLLQANRKQEAIADMQQVLPTWVGFSKETLLIPWYMLRPLSQIVAGERGDAKDFWKDVYKNHRYVYGQRLWHMAAFILKEIDEEGFRTQPRQPHLESDLILARALREELDGDPEDAVLHYRTWLALPSKDKRIQPEVDRYLRWRLREFESAD